jgi:hypothetical protein
VCCDGRVTYAGNGKHDEWRTVMLLARVTAWEGGTAEGIRAASEEMRSNVSQGPPPGVKSTGFTMLADPQGERVLTIGLFETEEDLHESEAALLEEMNPPDGLGKRRPIDVYEVVADVRV